MNAAPRKDVTTDLNRPETAGGRRSYMVKDDRRRMLLEQAAHLVETHDWSELNMSALAAQAGISRQLVYQHFPNLETLLIETATFLFTELWNNTQHVVEDDTTELVVAVRKAAQLSFDLSDGRGDALSQVLMGTNRGSPELVEFSRRIRTFIIEMWTPRIARELNLKKPAVRSMVWTMNMSFWGLRQLVRDGLLTRKQALEHFDAIIKRMANKP